VRPASVRGSEPGTGQRKPGIVDPDVGNRLAQRMRRDSAAGGFNFREFRHRVTWTKDRVASGRRTAGMADPVAGSRDRF